MGYQQLHPWPTDKKSDKVAKSTSSDSVESESMEKVAKEATDSLITMALRVIMRLALRSSLHPQQPLELLLEHPLEKPSPFWPPSQP